MCVNFKYYHKSYDNFVQFQYGLRRRVLENYCKCFRKRITKNLTKYPEYSLRNDEFISRVISLLNIPDKIIFNENEKISIIQESDKTINGIYNLLGSGDIELNPIEWHTDFKTGFRWPPGLFYTKYIQEDINTDSDVKIPRELSRSHHLLKLGLAYRLTNNKKYADFCIAQIKDWIDNNPLMYSINWGCTMDVAIRAINWIWTLGLIKGSENLDNATIQEIKCSLYQHGWFIYQNPEKGLFNSGNHYLADLAGQIHLGLLFRDLEKTHEWLKKGQEELFHEIRYQILPSGMSYERSTNYNRLVLELVLIPILLLKRNGFEIPIDIWYRLEKMFEFIMYSLKPDGTSPIFGDQDNGRLLPFNQQDTINFQYLLSLGALLFDQPHFKHHSEGFNIYCSIMGGDEALEKWRKITDLSLVLGSIAFPDVGLYIMRKEDNYLAINTTGRGLYPELKPGSHTHSDLFSFELFTQGKSFLIDPGSYVYTADADQRMLFRSTKMHNTITVDKESQDILCKEKIWSFNRTAIPEVIKWESNEKQDFIILKHNGYSRLPEPVIHERAIIFNKTSIIWVIKDKITGEGMHIYEWFFHFDIGIDFIINDYVVKTNCKDGRNIMLIFKQEPKIILRKERSFVSKSYGTKEDAYVLVATLHGIVPVALSIEIHRLRQD